MWTRLNRFTYNNIVSLTNLQPYSILETVTPLRVFELIYDLQLCHTTMWHTVISVSYTFSSHYRTYKQNISKLLQAFGMYRQLSLLLLHIVYIMLLFILIYCFFNIVSEWLYYSTYIKSVPQGMPHQTCIFTAQTSRWQTILIKF